MIYTMLHNFYCIGDIDNDRIYYYGNIYPEKIKFFQKFVLKNPNIRIYSFPPQIRHKMLLCKLGAPKDGRPP